MNRLTRLNFATWRSPRSGKRPFIARFGDTNEYIAKRFDLSNTGIELTAIDPDFLIILNHLNYDLEHPKERTIGVVTEPTWSSNFRPEYLSKRCAIVLSHEPSLISNGVKANTLCVPWLTLESVSKIPPKSRKLSFITSPLQSDNPHTNYRYRHDLVKAILGSDIDCDIYGNWAGADPRIKGFVNEKAEALLSYEFSIAIENTRESGYATEKLIDCILAETIPIYLGDPMAPGRFGSGAVAVLPSSVKSAVALLREIVNNRVYDAQSIRQAKKRYLTSSSLIVQIINTISEL